VTYCCLILGPATLGQYLQLQSSASERAWNSKKNDHLKYGKTTLTPSGYYCPDIKQCIAWKMKPPTQELQLVSRFIFSLSLGQTYNCFSSSKHVKYLEKTMTFCISEINWCRGIKFHTSLIYWTQNPYPTAQNFKVVRLELILLLSIYLK
jgi:hypothetical protein